MMPNKPAQKTQTQMLWGKVASLLSKAVAKYASYQAFVQDVNGNLVEIMTDENGFLQVFDQAGAPAGMWQVQPAEPQEMPAMPETPELDVTGGQKPVDPTAVTASADQIKVLQDAVTAQGARMEQLTQALAALANGLMPVQQGTVQQAQHRATAVEGVPGKGSQQKIDLQTSVAEKIAERAEQDRQKLMARHYRGR